MSTGEGDSVPTIVARPAGSGRPASSGVRAPANSAAPPASSSQSDLEQASTMHHVAARSDAPSGNASRSVVTPELALQAVEARRAWILAVGLFAVCGGGVLLALWMGGDRLALELHVANLAAVSGLAGLYALIYRDPARYHLWLSQGLGYLASSTLVTGFFYWGVYSAFAAGVPLAVYVFASSATRFGAWLGCVLCIVAHAGLAIAQLAGVIEPHGLIGAMPLFSTAAQLGALVMFQVLVVIATVGGRDSKRTMERVLAEHHAAQRALVQRDALLAEAHARVRDARGAREGRYSGEQLGRFALGVVLGRGAMGEVYDATDDAGKPVAVKVLAAHLAHDPKILARFQREARAIGALDAPNIVRMIEVSPPDARVPYFAMEKLDGRDLGELIQQQPRRELAEVVAIVVAVAAGLDAAHAAGVIHRDLKPANIFAAGETWKILDFGVSKLTAPDATATADHVLGTPGYMAPEQARGEVVDRRADVYALGVVAYRLLTGTPAIVPSDFPAMIHEVVYRMPPRPSAAADLPAAVEAVLAIALAKAPADRFATAGELAVALVAVAADAPPAAIIARADAILAKTPWGAWQRKPRQPAT
jgi:serine/threonine-protein kinase